MTFWKPIALSAAAALTLSQTAPDLRVTDSKGAQVLVTGAYIDYGGVIAFDREADGIRVQQGDGLVNVKWSIIDTLRVTKVDDEAKPKRLDLDIVLRSHKHIPATLLQKGSMQLVGKSELGDYAIDLNKVRMIVPAR